MTFSMTIQVKGKLSSVQLQRLVISVLTLLWTLSHFAH
jgi:hypothetical protein